MILSRRVIRDLTRSFLLDEVVIVPASCRSAPTSTISKPSTVQCQRSYTFSCQRHYAQSASSSRWLARQSRDPYGRAAQVQGLKSRAAFKLLQLHSKHRLFKPGMTVVDLGYAPGSWTQVAVNRTQPNGRVIGVDILPAQPPRGASTIQGDFLSPDVQKIVREYVQDPQRGRLVDRGFEYGTDEEEEMSEEVILEPMEEQSYLDAEKSANAAIEPLGEHAEADQAKGRVVDVVLSDMWEPWPQSDGFSKMSISNPYLRLMNTSGVPYRDHAVSMDLCTAALRFSFDTLKAGGHFVCKFYQGGEDKDLETKLKRLFGKVHREKPDASRKESREGYFVALRRKPLPSMEEVFAE